MFHISYFTYIFKSVSINNVMIALEQFIRKPVSDEERFKEAKSWGYTDRQAKKYVELAKFNGLNILGELKK